MEIKPGEEQQAFEAVNGFYERYRPLRAGDVVVDIGAHVGYFTTRAAGKVGPTGKVWAFEPHPANYSRLVENCKGLVNVMTINAAAWLEDFAAAELYPMAGNSGGHSLFGFDGHLPTIKVQTVDIGRFLFNGGIKPDFIKIDAESAELGILQSILRTGIKPAFAIEIHSELLYGNCYRLLKENSYEVNPETPICRRSLMYADIIDDIGAL